MNLVLREPYSWQFKLNIFSFLNVILAFDIHTWSTFRAKLGWFKIHVSENPFLTLGKNFQDKLVFVVTTHGAKINKQRVPVLKKDDWFDMKWSVRKFLLDKLNFENAKKSILYQSIKA